MPRVRDSKDGSVIITFNRAEASLYGNTIQRFRECDEAIGTALRKIFDSPSGTKDPSSRNKPLAPRKPAGSRAKGNAPKGRKPPRKVADKG
jgi:hypothetical protein